LSEPGFRNGDRVTLRAEPLVSGIVTSVAEGYAGGWTYEVFFGATDTRHVNEGGLAAAHADRRLSVLDHASFLIHLLLAKLDSPLSDLLYSYQASRTQFEAYQFKPVLKYLDAPTGGILIADEVGLGKTIEAAILHQELKARFNIARVLVICPAGLRVKWQTELLTRFDESFMIMDRRAVLEDLRLYRETNGRQPLNGIVGLETIRMRQLQDDIEQSEVRYDLVIVDEAHHLRTAGRLSNAIGEKMAELTDNLALLTATPLQTSQVDLYNLLKLIDETMFDGFDDFLDQLAPNRNLNAAVRALRERPPNQGLAIAELQAIEHLRAGGQVTAHPNFAYVLRHLEGSLEDRDERIELQRQIDQMNVLAPIYTRTRKRDVAQVAKRQAHVIKVATTPDELHFYNAVLAHARAQAQASSQSGWIPGFAGMMRERQAASCLAATREYLRDAYGDPRAILGVEDEEVDALPEGAVPDDSVGNRDSLKDLLKASMALPAVDSKFRMFLESLREVLADSPDGKVLVFSYFRRTLSYLQRELRSAGIASYLINGDVPPANRAAIIDQFRDESRVRVLLSSEVGAEGLDFEFADSLFNYDLPWNPMRVEQRIGRIDRYGQQKDKIRIYSFFLQDTIEERILERLYDRIGIFEDSVGDLEPILGPLTHELTQQIFMGTLTPGEEIELADRIADRIAFKRKEQSALEERQSELLGQDALLLQAIDETVRSGRYVSAAELRAVTVAFVSAVGAIARVEFTPGEPTATVVTDAKLASAVEDFIFRSKDRRALASDFLARASHGARVAVTFEGEVAARLRRLEFLNLRHPLVQAAIGHFQGQQKPALPIADIDVASDVDAELPLGLFYFALFRVITSGAQPQTNLRAVVLEHDGSRQGLLEPHVLRLIQGGTDAHGLPPWTEADRTWVLDRARPIESAEAERLEAEAREKNEAVLAVREATLQRTFRARIAKRERQLAGATDERIQRLRAGEIRNTREELARRLAELETRRLVGVSFAPLAIGRLRVVGENGGSEAPVPGPLNRTATDDEPKRGPILNLEPYPEPPTSWHPRPQG